ncbi:MAG TPA: cyclomaltodextrinase N-terminal domain-containing protein, partial [Pyrinomonadaceae bacterium]|nr:cyclomaltodextrinase N-terminal domain-containing protein [Pyrinomonadaceae bacterium]
MRKFVLSASCALVFVALCHGAAAAQSGAPRVAKVEPPSWWAGHSINPVRLLVRGSNLHGVRVSADVGAPFELSGQSVNPAGTYIFVNLRIDARAVPGEYKLRFQSSAGSVTHPFVI